MRTIGTKTYFRIGLGSLISTKSSFIRAHEPKEKMALSESIISSANLMMCFMIAPA